MFKDDNVADKGHAGMRHGNEYGEEIFKIYWLDVEIAANKIKMGKRVGLDETEAEKKNFKY